MTKLRVVILAALLAGCGSEGGADFDGTSLDAGSTGGETGGSAGGSGGSESTSTGGAGGASVTTGSAHGADSNSVTTSTVSSTTTSASSTTAATTGTSTTGSVDPGPVPGCNTVPLEDPCTNGSERGSYSCPNGESGYYAADGRRWAFPDGASNEEILCTLLDFTLECQGVGEGCAPSASTTQGSVSTTGTSTTGSVSPSVPGCVAGNCAPGSFTKGSYCHWHPVDFPEGECFPCPQGWNDCDGQGAEFEGWEGGSMGCETPDSALNDVNQCGECGPDTDDCECTVDGVCEGGW